MKISSSISTGRFLLQTALLLGVAAPTFAQVASMAPALTRTNAAYVAEEPMAAKGYWRLHVDASANVTFIDFYDRDHALVYQETIPSRTVLLSPQNRQLLNQTTERLTNNRLLASAAKVTGLNAPSPATESTDAVLTAYEMATQTGFQVGSYSTPQGVLKVNWENPDGDPVYVTLLDASQRLLYCERSSVIAFGRKYNLSRLESGTYTLVVTHNQKPYTFRVSRREGAAYRVEQQTPRTLASILTAE